MKVWVIPPGRSAEFVSRMEDLLDLYHEPLDPERPVICLDEMPVGLLGHVVQPLAMGTGRDRREHHEYARNGSATVFGALDLKACRRLFWVSERRRALEFASFVELCLDLLCPQAKTVRLVLDNLNIHTCGSLYRALDPARARGIARRLEIHPTPRHGSWLNPIELEFAAAKKQCLSRRIPTLQELARELGAWQDERNQKGIGVSWTFDNPCARVKMASLYPELEQTALNLTNEA